MDVGPCHQGMARPQVADGGAASYMEGSCYRGRVGTGSNSSTIAADNSTV